MKKSEVNTPQIIIAMAILSDDPEDFLGNNPETNSGYSGRRSSIVPNLEDVVPDQYFPEDSKEDKEKNDEEE